MKVRRVILLYALLLATHQPASAQTDSSLVASVIAGGGGESGTIGQWDVSTIDQGTDTVASGFWNAEEVPWLRIQRTGGSILIAWPDSFIGFQLEQAPSVGAAATWGSVSQTANVANCENHITLSIGPSTRFFRLRKP